MKCGMPYKTRTPDDSGLYRLGLDFYSPELCDHLSRLEQSFTRIVGVGLESSVFTSDKNFLPRFRIDNWYSIENADRVVHQTEEEYPRSFGAGVLVSGFTTLTSWRPSRPNTQILRVVPIRDKCSLSRDSTLQWETDPALRPEQIQQSFYGTQICCAVCLAEPWLSYIRACEPTDEHRVWKGWRRRWIERKLVLLKSGLGGRKWTSRNGIWECISERGWVRTARRLLWCVGFSFALKDELLAEELSYVPRARSGCTPIVPSVIPESCTCRLGLTLRPELTQSQALPREYVVKWNTKLCSND